MRSSKLETKIADVDLTPMIDMVFQLIAFFLVVVNYSQNEQDQRVSLPQSELVKPSEESSEIPIVLHLAANGEAIVGGQSTQVHGLSSLLKMELNLIEASGKRAMDAVVIIRADKHVEGGRVQELIALCQELKLTRFVLRVKDAVVP